MLKFATIAMTLLMTSCLSNVRPSKGVYEANAFEWCDEEDQFYCDPECDENGVCIVQTSAAGFVQLKCDDGKCKSEGALTDVVEFLNKR